jgi:insertion element IS1 protein InsB
MSSNVSRPACPQCESTQVVKNGSIHSGKQKYRCKTCGRQFVEHPTKKYIDDHTKATIDKLLLERLSLRGIARATGVSFKWLQKYVNQKYSQTDWEAKDTGEPEAGIELMLLEADELWSFVKYKLNQVWIWLILDRRTRRILACYMGDRTRASAEKLWHSLPERYRNNGTCYTDFWQAYATVIPAKQHQAVGKETGETSHIERFNNTLRQRISRLVRQGLSFSRKLFNHRSAIWNFIHHYNAELETG